MISSSAIVFSVLLTVSWCSESLIFPPGFKFGAGSSAYQVEGGWNASDKGVSIWDYMLHSTEMTNEDGSSGDVTCDSYHQWRRDVEMAAELGLKHYRFSISWPRLLPEGFPTRISEDGKNYYNNLINGLLERNIEPLVTIYHFDLPQRLQDLGGWTNPLVADWFADYARVVYSLFSDRVKTWITLNEPLAICDMAYIEAMIAPRIKDDVAAFLCSKNVIIAHARAWRIYDEEYKPIYNGKVSICNHWLWYEPEALGDEDAAELALDFIHGRYSHPIYSKKGGWSPTIEKAINNYAYNLGYTQPWLPAFTQEEIDFVRGTYDCYAFNLYTSRTARFTKPGEEDDNPFLFYTTISMLNLILKPRPEWIQTFAPIFHINPEGLRKHLIWAKEKYGDIDFFIMESGLPTAGSMDDDDRIDYIYDHLKQVWLAMSEDCVNITGYTYWSIMDSFELTSNLSKFGLYHVDFESELRTRIPRKSACFYSTVIKNNGLEIPNSFNHNQTQLNHL